MVSTLWEILYPVYQRLTDCRDGLLQQLPKASVGAEIGVDMGDFSARILKAVRPRELHLVDPWLCGTGPEYRRSLYGELLGGGQAGLDRRYRKVCRRFERQVRDGLVTIHRDTSEAAASRFPEASFDWVYIDGNHLYEFVRQDLELYWGRLKIGGYLAGDDYGKEGWWKNGVTRAVDEFCQRAGCLRLEPGHHQFLLQKVAVSAN